ncbi:N-acyl homoserine lactonase family protein [Marinibaculum pumilum]|uniref:N-acyl homoserine lactonase family protein n=1 Tax=Marinibaculum pumilum TaxID=1766165 RepID=A0ABV7KW06_9PROT
MDDSYELYAVRYGHHDRNAAANFIGGDEHDGPMPLDYFVWAIVGQSRTFVFDTGFDADSARRRNRQLLRPVGEGLKMIGIEPDHVQDVIVSHMHFDHVGNNDLFPQARYHVQDAEMQYCTGRCMCHAYLRHAYDHRDVASMIDKLFADRVTFHDGESQIAPNLTVHRVGGHTRGLQVVRVLTRRGWVVLGSDASHFYANFEQNRPFPVVESATEMLEGYATMRRLATSSRHIVPGHDPLVLDRYPAALDGVADIVRLDLDPTG